MKHACATAGCTGKADDGQDFCTECDVLLLKRACDMCGTEQADTFVDGQYLCPKCDGLLFVEMLEAREHLDARADKKH
jgi:hypothetical protein